MRTEKQPPETPELRRAATGWRRAVPPLLIALVVAPLVAGGLLSAAAPARAAEKTEVPPILDRELFFGDPEISGAQLSPDGRFISFIKPYKGTRNLWVKRTEQPFDAAKPVTADTLRPIRISFWSWDSKYLLYVQDRAGDENFHVYALNPAEAPAAGQDVPTARDLTDLKNVRAQLYAVPKALPDTIYVGLNDRDAAWHDLYKVNLTTGARTLLRKNADRVTRWIFDLQGQLRLATRAAENGDTEVLRVDADGFKKVYTCNVSETCAPVRFHKDGRRVYMETNKGDDVDLSRLVLFDAQGGKEELVESDPMKRVDFGNALFSEKTDELVGTSYEDDRQRYAWREPSYAADFAALTKQLPGKDLAVVSATRDDRLWLVAASSDTEPGETHLYDRKAKKLTLQYRIHEKLPRQHLASMQVVHYPSSDGLQIPGYLTLPKGVEPKKLPLVLLVHGGPWGRDSWGYDSIAQFLANRGYAVLQPNFRASTGYGKKFVLAGNREWGQKMQDDLTWGVKYLVAQGTADARRVGIMGGSYGGYATLAGVAFTPDVYAAGVSIVGPSNLITLLESIPPYWESIRKLFAERMGDPSTPEGKAQLERQSPLHSAAQIKTPLLVVQGANDPRVKRAESDQIVVALRERNFPVEYLVAPDEGHGFARPVNNLALFASAERFLAKHLGGRYQEGMPPEVAQRLKEITVDVKTVERPKRVAAAAVGTPKPVADLKAGTDVYPIRMEIAGRTLDLKSTTEIKQEGNTWVIKDSTQTPGGEVLDVATLDKATLTLRRRTVKQGPLTIELDFNEGKVSGQVEVAGKKQPVAADLGGALFADGAGAFHSVGALPLAAGYTTTFRNFDLRKQKASLKQLRVVGIEKVTVQAGVFDAFKVEIDSAEGDPGKVTVWIAKTLRKPVKIIASVPEQGGAVVTSELGK
ncbi:MAG TPA: alpha/beta fold hydrolase [Polyangia bacterium]|nr:alpha/beta fold hydrolase [Polyangia bacterium]